nr:hypothetical protein [Tanacetum cinerariifolium]
MSPSNITRVLIIRSSSRISSLFVKEKEMLLLTLSQASGNALHLSSTIKAIHTLDVGEVFTISHPISRLATLAFIRFGNFMALRRSLLSVGIWPLVFYHLTNPIIYLMTFGRVFNPTSHLSLAMTSIGIKRLLSADEVNAASYEVTTADYARKNELKARGTLLMALSNEHQLKFYSYKNIKSLMEAIEKRFGDLETLSMDDLYNNLKIYETKVKGSSSSSQNSQNVAFVSSNNSGSTNQALGSNSVNIDRLSDSVIYSFFANQSNSSQLNNEDLQQINADDLEEMNLKWQMAMLTMRAKRFLKKTGRKVGANGSKIIGFDKIKVKCYNYHKRGHFTRECRVSRENRNKELVKRNAEDGPANFALMAYTSSGSSSSSSSLSSDYEARLVVYKKNEEIFEENIKILKLDIHLINNALKELRKKLEKAEKERDEIKITLEKFENSSKTLNKMFNSQVNDKNKTGVRYHAVPPPYTGNFMPPKSDLILADVDEYVVSESVTSVPVVATNEAKTSESKPKSVSEPLTEVWVSDSEDENETETKYKQRKPSFATVEFVKPNE